MDDSSSDFQEKKKNYTGPKNVQRSKVNKPKKPLKIKRQRDIRTLIKNKNSELVSYSKNFNQVCKESGVDVDSEQLQLAIALSKSLYETEVKPDDNSKESKPLTSEERTAKIRTTLQEYGFRVPNTKIAKNLNKRNRFKKQYKLLLVSDDEKQQIISDRYAEVLAKNIHKSPKKNNTLHSYNDQEIFHKSTNLLYEFMKNDDVFYVKDLFEKPLTKLCLLRDWAKIPGRVASPKREVKSFNFDNIQCTQDELDCILSGSIHAAQSIIENKHFINNCNMDINNKNKSPTRAIDLENHTTISISNELDNFNTTYSDNYVKKIINSEDIIFVDTNLSVAQKIRSVSPDIFDDDISLDNDTNKSVRVLQEIKNQSKNNVINFMDLTECVNNAPEWDKTFKNKLSQKNISSRKSNDLMEITECVHASDKQSLIDNIDLTQGFIHLKNKNYTNNLKTEILEMDLTQSSNSDVDVPEITIDAKTYENSLDETIVNHEYIVEIPNLLTSNEKLTSPTRSNFANDCSKQDSFDEQKKIKNVTNNSFVKSYTKHEENNSHLFEYYTAKKLIQNSKNNGLEITESLSSGKQTLIENFDLTQSANKINVTNRKSNDLMEITECVPTSTKQCLIENIDLTQSYNNLKKENNENNFVTENFKLDLIQSSISDKIFPVAEISSTKTDYLLDKTVIIIEDSELNPDTVARKGTFIVQNDSKFAKDDDHRTESSFKLENINTNCKNSLSKNYNEYEDNNLYFSEYHNEINLNKENNKNLDIDLTQSSNSDNNPVEEIDGTKKEISLDKAVRITEDVESNPDPVINKELSNDSEYASDAINKSKEKNEPDSFNENVINDNFYSFSEHMYNNSYIFDDCKENDISKNNTQDKILIENIGFDNDINRNSPSYTENPNSCTLINDNDRNTFENSEKNNNAKNAVEELDNIDLTQSSYSSNDTIENHNNPKAYDINNLGKIDNISIDYDEMFDDVVSTGSKYVSQTSLKSYNSNNSISRKADNSNNEVSSNSSKTSNCFEISDKEFNYSLHQSRHNFDIGGLSVLDNVSNFKMQSFKECNRLSRINLNRSLSDSDLPSANDKKNTVCTPKALLKSNTFVSETTTPVINRCIIEEVQNTPRNSDYIIKTRNVTPMLDYESMTSPERNRELEKYGLKPFKRKRAIQLLKHLYDQTHPVVESCDIEECSSPSKRRKYDNENKQCNSLEKPIYSPRKSPKKSQRSPRKHESNLAEVDKENTLYAETKETPDIKEIICIAEDWVFQKREKAKVHSCKVPLHIAFHNYLSCRQLLRESILRYEPINIDVIHKDLVACGYKYNPKDLLRFLDKKCITVKTVDNNSRNRKS